MWASCVQRELLLGIFWPPIRSAVLSRPSLRSEWPLRPRLPQVHQPRANPLRHHTGPASSPQSPRGVYRLDSSSGSFFSLGRIGVDGSVLYLEADTVYEKVINQGSRSRRRRCQLSLSLFRFSDYSISCPLHGNVLTDYFVVSHSISLQVSYFDLIKYELTIRSSFPIAVLY